MTANFTSGFFVRQPAWHGMGTVLDDYPASWDEARQIAGLDWEPLSAPGFGFTGTRTDGTRTFDPADPNLDMSAPQDYQPGMSYEDVARLVMRQYGLIENKQRIVHSATGATLGVPSADYAIINHAEMGAIVEAVSAQPNVRYETTVVLEGGKSVAAVARLDEPVTIPGDNTETLPYLALTTRHDGAGSCRAQSTTVRIVCANTFAMAEAEADRNGTVFVFSHTKNWRDHVEEAQQAIRGLREDFADYVEFAGEMAGIRVSTEQTADFLSLFIPAPLESVAVSNRVANNIEEARQTVQAILDSVTCEAIRGTAFGLIQAGGEWLDHYRGYRNLETYMGRQLLKPEKRKTELVSIVRELVSA